MKKNRFFLILIFFILTVYPLSLNADEVMDSINEALEYYKEGDHKAASSSLEYASQLIRQKRADTLQDLLPEPLEEWQADEAKSQAIGAALFGGGVTAERHYGKGTGSVNVKYLADSPMMQSMMMLFTNPTFVTASGGKLERIGGEKAIIEYDSHLKKGKITVLVGTNLVVTLEGKNVEKDDLMAYAKEIDYKKLSAFK